MKTLVVRSFFFINFFRKNRLPEVTIYTSTFIPSCHLLEIVNQSFSSINIIKVKDKTNEFHNEVCDGQRRISFENTIP